MRLFKELILGKNKKHQKKIDVDFGSLPSLLTIDQVSEIFQVHPNTLRNWDKSGKLKAVRIGVRKDRRYEKDAVINFYESLDHLKNKSRDNKQLSSKDQKGYEGSSLPEPEVSAYVIKPGLSWSKIKLLLISKRFSVFVYSVSLVAFAFLTIQVTFFTYIYIAQAKANGPQIFILPIQPRESSGWDNAKQALNIDLLGTDGLSDFNKENSAFFINQPSVDIEEKIQDNTEPFATTESILEVGDFSAVDSIPKESTITETKIVVSYAIDSFKGNEDILVFSYSVDDGSTWEVFNSFAISEKESNSLNEGYLEYVLDDIELPEDLEGVRVKIEYNQVPSEEISIVYIDGINIYTTIQEPDEKINEEIVNSITVENKDLKIDEEPVLSVEVEEESTLSFLGVDPKQREIKDIIITNPAGEEIEGNVTIDTKEVGRLKIDEYKVNKDNFIKPGAYNVTFVVEQDGYSKKITEEFNWGVLAVNMRNSIGSPNTYTEVGMAVLDDEGRADCQASIDVSIEHPNGLIEQFSSEDGTVIANPKCIERNVTDQADYTVYFTTTDSGQYKITIEAEIKNGARTIEEIYEVSDSILFNVNRSTFPTRINPVWEYPVTFDVTVQEDYAGQIIETVPNGFEISNISNEGKEIVGNNKSITKKIIWDVDWKAGKTYTLGYTFDPPDLRRQFYALGPIIADQQSEARQWQMVLEGGDEFIEDLPLIVQNGKGKTPEVIKKEKINDENLKTDIIDENYQIGVNQKIILPKSGFVNNVKICRDEVGETGCNRWEKLDVETTNTGEAIEFTTSEIGMIAAFNDEESGNIKVIKQEYEQVNKLVEETELRQPDTMTYKKNSNENIKIQSSSYLNYFDGVEYLPLPEIAPPGEILVAKKPIDNKVLYVEVPEWAVIDLSADKKTVHVKDKAGTEIWRYELPYFFDPNIRPYPLLPVLNENLTETELLEVYPDGLITGLPEEESGILRECTEKSCVIDSESVATVFQVIDNKIYAIVPAGLSYPQILVDATDTASTNNKDSHMRKSLATKGYGTCTYLHVGKIVSATYDYRPIFEWTLSSGTGTITDIDLDLYRYNVGTYSGGNSATIRYLELHETTRTATEGSTCDATGATGVTWNTYDGTNSWTTAGGDMSATIVDEVGVSGSGTADAWYTWGLVGTNATNPISGLTWGSTFDFLIYNPDSYITAGNNLDYFYSKENTGTTYDPYITITYSTGTTISGTSNTTGTVKVAVNGTLQTASATISASAWSLTTDSAISTGDTVTAFINGATTNESTAVTEYDGIGSVTGMVLNSNVLSVGSADTGVTLTVTQLGQYDNDNDEDIMHSANLSVLTVDANNVYANDTIDILAADTLTISGTETLTAHNVTINGSLTSGGASIYNVSGSWDNNSDFNTSTETINLTNTGADTFNNTGAVDYDVNKIIKTGGGTMTFAGSTVTINNTLAVNGGTLSTGVTTNVYGDTNTVTVGGGTLTQTAGTFNIGNGTVEDLVINSGIVTLSGGITNIKDDLIINGGTVTISNTVNITNTVGGYFDQNGGTVNVNTGANINLSDRLTLNGASSIFNLNDGSISSQDYWLLYEGTFNFNGGTHNVGTVQGFLFIYDSGTGIDFNMTGTGTITTDEIYMNGIDITTTTTTGGTIIINGGANGLDIRKAGLNLYNVQISTSTAIDILSTEVNIVNDFTIDSLTSFNTNSIPLKVGGNIVNSGTFTPGTGIVTLNGTGTQTITGMSGLSSFYNLTITNIYGSYSGCSTSFTPGVSFSNSATINGTYTITTNNVKVKYNSGSTYTINNINWSASVNNDIIFRNSVLGLGTWLLNVSGIQTAVSYVDVGRSDASSGSTIVADNGTNTDCLNNTNWTWPVSSTTISGTSNTTGTVKVAINGILQTASATISASAWSLSTDSAITTGDTVTAFINGAVTASESTAVTEYDGTGDVTGMVLNSNVLSIGSADTGVTLTVTQLGQYDNDNDEDIMHSANTSVLTVDASNVYATDTVEILAADTLTISGTETLIAYTVKITGTLTSGGGSVYTINGDWTNNGTFNASTSTATFGDTGGSINGSNDTTFYNLTIDTTGVLNDVTIGSGTDDPIVTNNLTIAANDFLSTSTGRTITINSTASFTFNGYIDAGGTFIYKPLAAFPATGTITNPAIVRFDSSNNSQNLSARNYFAVEIYGNNSSNTVTAAVGTYTINNLITSQVGTGATIFNLDTNDPALTISTTTTIGTSTTIITSSTNVTTFSGNVTNNGTITHSTGTINVNGTFTNNSPFTASTGTLNFNGNFSNTSTFTASASGALNFKGNYTNSGTFTDSLGTATFSGTATQILSGTMTGSSDFYNLTITNSYGSYSGCSTSFTPGVSFGAGITISGTYTITTNNVKVSYNSGSIYTVNNINWSASSANDIIFRNSNVSSGSWRLNVSGIQTAVSYVNVAGSDANGGNQIVASDGTNTDCGSNVNWNFGGVSGTVVSGTSNGTGTVKIAVGTSLQGGSSTISGGTWNIITDSVLTSGAVITAFIDNVAEASESTAITKYDGTGDITGMVLNANVLSVGSVDNPSLTIGNFDYYRNANDEDVMQSVLIGTNNKTLYTDYSGNYVDETFNILSGATFTMSSDAGAFPSKDILNTHNVVINGSFTTTSVNNGSSDITVSGSWDNNNDFNSSIEDITFTSTTTETMDNTGAIDYDVDNVSFNGVGGQWTLTTALTANGNLTLSNGTLVLGSLNHTVGGNLDLGGGTVTAGSSTITMTGTANTIVGGGKTLNNLTIDPATAGTITLQTSDIAVSGTVNVATGDTLSLNSGRTVTVNSTGTLTLSGTISGAGRLTYKPSAAFPTAGTISSILRFDTADNNQTMSVRSYGGDVEIYNNTINNRIVTPNASGLIYISSGSLYVIGDSTGTITLATNINNPSFIIGANLDFTGTGVGTEEIINSGSSEWKITGTADFRNGVYTATTGNTLNFYSSGSLWLGGNELYNLSNTLSGTLTVNDALVVNGNLTLDPSTTFIAPSSLTLKGNYTNNGNFTHSNGTVTLAGTGAQTLAGQMTGANDKFYNLTITNATALITFSNNGAETANNYTITTAGVTVIYAVGQTYTFQNINWAGATGLGNEITFQSSTPTSAYNMTVNGTQTNVSYVKVADSNACTGNNWIDASNGTNTDSGNNDCWMFSSITVSGTLLSSGETVGYNCFTDNVTLHVTQRGARSGTATCTSFGGTYSITAAAPTGTGDSLAVYADSGEPTFQGTTVTTAADAVFNIIGLDLIAGNVVVRHEDVGPISNSDLSAVDDGDAGIRYAVSGTTINVDSGINLHINNGDTYNPNGKFTTSGGGQLHLDDNSIAYDDTATSVSSGNTVVDIGATFNVDAIFSTSGDILVEGTIQGSANITVNGGNLTGDGVVNMTGGDVTFPVTGNIGGNTNWTFFDLSLTQTPTVDYTTTALGTGNITVTNTLIGDSVPSGLGDGNVFVHYLDPGSKLWILSGTGTPMNVVRTFTGDGSSTFRYTGTTTAVIVDGGKYSTLELSPTLNTTYQHGEAVGIYGNLTINNNVAFDAGVGMYIIYGTATTIDTNGVTFYNFQVWGPSASATVTNTDFSVSNFLIIHDTTSTLNIPTGRTVTLTSASSLTLTGIISGAGQLTYQPATAFPTTGTISSKLRFDSTNNNQTMSARTYGGDVEVYNNSGVSARTVTMATGTHNLSSNLYLNSANTQNVSLSGSTNNPTINVVGNLDFTGVGVGSEAISSGTGTWTVSGNVDFTGGTYSPATNNILLMDGTVAGLTTNVQTLYNFQTGGSGTITLNDALTTTGDITIGNGSTLSSANNITVNGGNLTTPSGTGTGILNHTAGTVSLSTTGNVGGNGNWTINNLSLTQASCGGTTITTGTGSGTMTVTNVLTTDSCFNLDTFFHRLDGGAKTWILTSAGTPFVNNGGFSGNTSTFRYTGAGDTNIVNGTKGISTGYYNLELKPSGGINPTYTIADATINSLNNITIGDGTNDVIVSATVNNPAVTIGNNISCTTGASTNTVNTGTGTWTVSGNVDLTNCDTWTATTGHTLVMNGASKTITSGGKSLYNYTVSAGSSILQDVLVVNGNVVISGGSLDTKLGVNNNITLAGNWTNSATFVPRLGTVTFNGGSSTAGTFTIDSIGAVVDDFYNVVFNDAGDGDTFQLGSIFDVNGNLTITGGTLDTTLASSYPITLAGNWTNNDTFTSRSGTVTADGTTTQTFGGTMTGLSKFYNLTVTNAGASNPDIIFATNTEMGNTFSANTGSTQLQFNAGSTYTFNNANFNGTAGNLVTLRSSLPGTQWNLTSLGIQSVTYTDVQDSYACGGDTIDASGGTNVNSQSNDCWIFVAMSVSISPNSINLGTLSNTLVSQDGVTLTVSTDASNGYSSTVYYDNTLTSAGSNTISDTVGGTIVAGTEEFGASSSAAGYTIAQWGNLPDLAACGDTTYPSNATALTTSPQTFAGATSSVTNQQTILCLLGSITGLTEAGTYTSTITIVATSLY